MLKEEQTKEILLELYNLTLNLTIKYQPQYYYQYRGEIADLASEFYCEFLTPKGRGEKKESLLDKFDPSVTSLGYLTKVAVVRKLIDRSRADSVQVLSINALVDEYGDMINKAFNLSNEDFEEFDYEDDEFFKKRVLRSFLHLDEFNRNAIYAKLYELSSKLCKILTPNFRYIHSCPVQQVTDKTVVLYVPDYKKCINFSLEDGHPRGSIKPFHINTENITQYQSGFSRKTFEDYFNLGISEF